MGAPFELHTTFDLDEARRARRTLAAVGAAVALIAAGPALEGILGRAAGRAGVVVSVIGMVTFLAALFVGAWARKPLPGSRAPMTPVSAAVTRSSRATPSDRGTSSRPRSGRPRT